jgi:activator of 2-hydroxyglutaryl-CoA dehydratase
MMSWYRNPALGPRFSRRRRKERVGYTVSKYRVGVDIGGTFTDIVFLGENGERLTKKVASTVDNYATAIVDGLGELLRDPLDLDG